MKLRKTYSLVYLVLTEGVHVYNVFLKNNWSSVGIIYRLKYRSPKADLLSNMTVKRNNSFWHFLQEAYMNVPCMLLYKSLHSFFYRKHTWMFFVCCYANIYNFCVHSDNAMIFICLQSPQCNRQLQSLFLHWSIVWMHLSGSQCLEHCIAVRYVNGLGMISYLENSCLSVNFVFPSYICICFRLDYILILKRKFKQ